MQCEISKEMQNGQLHGYAQLWVYLIFLAKKCFISSNNSTNRCKTLLQLNHFTLLYMSNLVYLLLHEHNKFSKVRLLRAWDAI